MFKHVPLQQQQVQGRPGPQFALHRVLPAQVLQQHVQGAQLALRQVLQVPVPQQNVQCVRFVIILICNLDCP